MPAEAGLGESSSYFSGFFTLVQASAAQIVRSPSHPRRAAAARRSLRHALLLTITAGGVMVVSMYGFDATEIGLMPPRGAGVLWPVRILTDFGKSAYVLCALAAALLAVATILPRLRGAARSTLLRFGTHLQFVFFAVLVPVFAGEIIKWVVGRGRPFVGGEANAFNFVHFAGTEAYASWPCDRELCAGFRGKRGLAGRAPDDDCLCSFDRDHPARAFGPSSERRGCGCVDRRGRRDVRAILVCRASFGLLRRPRWRNSSTLWIIAGRAQKGCPPGVSLIRSGRCRRRMPCGSSARLTQMRVVICLLLTQPGSPFPSWSPCATRPRT